MRKWLCSVKLTKMLSESWKIYWLLVVEIWKITLLRYKYLIKLVLGVTEKYKSIEK